jgi:predicted NUDIX family phosphoesterase
MADDEMVMCVTRLRFEDALGVANGVSRVANQYNAGASEKLSEMLLYTMHRPRSECETDETVVQIIPYIVVTYGDFVLCYQRENGGEKRLDGKWSLGFGGHINDGDSSYLDGLRREGHEELLGFSHGSLTEPLGFIWDNSNPVGRVHLGVLHAYQFGQFGSAPIAPAEACRTRWEPTRLVAFDSRLENWSKIAVKMIQEWGHGRDF